MPSPFPGMDPYLESSDWFPDLRSGLLVHMKAQLNQILPRPYHARSNYRFWREYTRHPLESDHVAGHSVRATGERGRKERALVEPQPAGPLIVSLQTVEQGPFKQAVLEIRVRHGKEARLVTGIEIPSTYDKEVDHPSREQYIRRQRNILGGAANLVEIDLLRGVRIPRLSLATSSRQRRVVSITLCRSIGTIDLMISSSIRFP